MKKKHNCKSKAFELAMLARNIDIAHKEFLKGKPRAKSEEEAFAQEQDFEEWYNFKRKRPDTDKTQIEMGDRVISSQVRINSEGRLEAPASRTCPECERFGLEVTEDVNTYECKICGSAWKRLKPTNDGYGNMVNMPAKLKKLLRESGRENTVEREAMK